MAHLLEPPLLRLGVSAGVSAAVTQTVALAIAFSILTFLHIVVGEVAPKTLAIARAEGVAIFAATPLRIFHAVFFPAIWLLNAAANGLLRLLRLPLADEGAHSHPHTRDELKLIVEETDGMSRGARDILLRALDFHGRRARMAMVPRSSVAFLDLRRPLEANARLAKEQGYTRYPLCDGDIDHVVGMVHLRDLLQLAPDAGSAGLDRIKRSPLFVPEAMPLGRLLLEFQARKTHLAVVVDEYGGTSGLVTLEDLLEELVGEIQDEFDDEAPTFQALGGGVYLVDGGLPLDEAYRRLGIEGADPDNVTIGGHVVKLLGRVAQPGDRSVIGDYEVRVDSTAAQRIARLRFTRMHDAPPLAPSGPGDDVAQPRL